jgi:hypothetical protein
VITLADDSFGGRNNNTAGSTMAQNFLIDELELIADGLNSAQSGDDAFKQPFTLGTNILAVIPGGELANEYVMVGAHYDHVGSSCPSSVVGDPVCNGATDNAAGVAAVLAVGRAIASLPDPPRRSVILVLWDREEDGLLGSQFYVQNPLVPLASTIAYVNFDIQGANLLPSLKNFSAAVSPETGGAVLRGLVDDAVSGEGLGTRKLSFIFESYAEYRAARTYVYDTARRLDLASHGNRLDADATKLIAARVGKEIADRAIQVLGGYGYMGEYVVERLWRDAKLLEIGGGTLEAHQKNITKDLARAPEVIRGRH